MLELDASLRVAAAGAALGALFGYTVRRSDFCMMGAVADVAISGSWLRLRAWFTAIAVALVATQALVLGGVIDLGETRFLAPVVPWLGIALGGLAFGFGMVIACGCPSRNAVNAACGDLRAVATLLSVGVFAAMTMRGLLALPRVWLNTPTAIDTTTSQWIGAPSAPHWLSDVASIDPATARGLVTAVLAGALVLFCLKDADYRASTRLWLAGVVIGLLVAAAWWLTTAFGADDFDPAPVESLTFVRPAADGLLYLMLFTGSSIDFGIASFAGVLAGAMVAGITHGRLQLRGFEDAREMTRHIAGGALMGAGGVLALGCTVGQGIAGVATLSLGSALALAAIITGGLFGARSL